MSNFKDDYALADVIAEEHTEVLWGAIQKALHHNERENATSDSLRELGTRLQEVELWMNMN